MTSARPTEASSHGARDDAFAANLAEDSGNDQRGCCAGHDEHKDAQGNAFVRFAVDAHHGFGPAVDGDDSRWQLATITGCAYVDRSQVFVQRGAEYRPAAFLLGKNVKAAAEATCQPAHDQVAHAN